MRSANMSAIKSTGTKAEITLSKALWQIGHRYRKNNKKIFGKPDLTFTKYKLAIFVDGEFWHGKDFETKKKPINNAEFWEKKIERNMARDQAVNRHLTSQGWIVLRFWSTQIKKDLEAVIATIEQTIISIRTKKYKSNDKDDLLTLPLITEP
jgi:DNA mismatch endonuclease (patch repair protein)